MKERSSLLHFTRWLRAAGACVCVLVGLASCDQEREATGAEWVAPPDSAMPEAFTPDEKVPHFARKWTMPKGFQGFTERWNKRNADYVKSSLESRKAECVAAFAAKLGSCPRSEGAVTATVGIRSSLRKCRTFGERRRLGDYLVYREYLDLPRDLKWQTGDNQPELGSPEARKGGTLRLSLQRSFPGTLCPFGPNSNNSTRRYLYDDIDIPLVRIHPGTGELIPGVADKWAVSEDGRTIYFHLDKEACFSNGIPLTSRDFITSLFVRTSEYSAEPFYGDFYLSRFSRITVYGNGAIAVTLPEARPAAPFYASLPACCTRFYAEFGPDYPTRYLWRPAPTTGAYRVDAEGVVMGRQLTMERVPDWWGHKRRYMRYSCNVDRIVYSFVAEASKARELFRIGQLDVFSARDADFWYEGLEIEPVHRGYIQRVHFSNIWPRNSFGFHLNCSRAPFDNKNVRLGMQHALNIQSVIDTVFRGDYVRMGSYFMGFGPYTNKKITARPYSPEKAREYFALAGYTEEGGDGILSRPDGTRLQVVVSSRIDPLYANCMNLLREDAAACGLDLRFEQMDDTVFFSKLKEKNYTAGIFSWGFSPIMPDPTLFFLSGYAYNTDGTLARGTSNVTATASPELDAAILACQAAATEQEAIEAHHRVQELIHEEACWVPGWTTSYWRFAQWRWLRWPDTKEYSFCPPRYFDPLDSHLYWIDEDELRRTMNARSAGEAFPEQAIEVPLPEKL
ncbi:MAG: hypothetical protein IKZ13_00880 [Akkermansia sp.]|nr:hypothetical protein [Akkermansia sp.]